MSICYIDQFVELEEYNKFVSFSFASKRICLGEFCQQIVTDISKNAVEWPDHNA